MPNKRQTHFSLFMRFNLWVAVLMLPAAFAVLTFSQGMVGDATQLSQNGVTTIAQVEKGWTEFGSSSNSKTEWLEVTYWVRGEPYTAATTVTQSTRARAQREGTVQVRFVENDPTLFEINPGTRTKELWLVRGAGLLLFFIGAYWLWRGLTRIFQLFWLEKKGVRAPTTITRIEKTGWSVKDWEFRLIWVEPDGSEGRSLMSSEYRLKAHPNGSEIEILRDPAGRVPSAWVGDLEVWP